MIQIDDLRIRRALESHLENTAGLPRLCKEALWQDLPETFIYSKLVRFSERYPSIGHAATDGYLQVECFVPIGSGAEQAEIIASIIKTSFAPDQYIDQYVYINETSILTGYENDGKTHFVVPVQIDYRVDRIETN